MKVGAEGGNDEPSSSRNTELGATVRRKVRRVQERVERMGPEGLEQRLRGPPVAAPYAWTSTVSALVEVGRAPALLAEVGRAGAQEGPRDVAQRAFGLIKAGADAVVVRCDEEDTPDGLADLTATVRCGRVTCTCGPARARPHAGNPSHAVCSQGGAEPSRVPSDARADEGLGGAPPSAR